MVQQVLSEVTKEESADAKCLHMDSALAGSVHEENGLYFQDAKYSPSSMSELETLYGQSV